MSKYFIKGKGEVSLNKSDFKAAGGQGSVYIKGSTAYKIYADSKNMIPVAKIDELSAITIPNVIRPLDVLLDSKNKPVGYTMKTVDNGYALCQMFPKAFRNRMKLTPEMTSELVLRLRSGIEHVHSKRILIVDLNEMNFLVTDAFNEVYFLDVDSYQTKSFPATALMESVRDRHTPKGKFTEGSDWFSFGVVSFQMFTGIHPFKGTYDSFEHIEKDKRLDERMKQNISVLHKDVRCNAATLPFNVIPPVFMDWYRAVFESGKRIPPPSDLQSVIVFPQIKRQVGSENFNVEPYLTLKGDIIDYSYGVVLTTSGVYLENRRVTDIRPNAKIGITPKMSQQILAWLEDDNVHLFNLNEQKEINCSLKAESLMSYDGRIYIKQGSSLLEIVFREAFGSTVITSRLTATVMEKATQVFEGCAIHSLLGAFYMIVFPEAERNYQLRMKELDGYQIVDAKFSKGVVMVVGSKKGKYDKFLFRFDSSYSSYDVLATHDIAYNGLNFTVLDSGIVISLNEQDEIVLFSSRKDNPKITTIKDSSIQSDVKLFSRGTRTYVARGNELSTITMRV